jgi:hypothetical protein
MHSLLRTTEIRDDEGASTRPSHIHLQVMDHTFDAAALLNAAHADAVKAREDEDADGDAAAWCLIFMPSGGNVLCCSQ